MEVRTIFKAWSNAGKEHAEQFKSWNMRLDISEWIYLFALQLFNSYN